MKVEIKEEIKRELWKMKETSLEGRDSLLALTYELCKLVPLYGSTRRYLFVDVFVYVQK